MEQEHLVEAAFLIPIREDRDVGNGRLHSYTRWQRLTRDLYHMFEGWSRTPGLIEGVYKDPDTGQPVSDKSRRYVVASVAGQVEFVEARYEAISDTEAGDL